MPEPPDEQKKTSVLKPVAAVLALATAALAVVAYEEHVQIQALKAAALSVQLCPNDAFPENQTNCGHNGKPACGVAAWTNGQCKVIQLTNTPGCTMCYAGQVTPCNGGGPCDPSVSSCGVRYCINTGGGNYNWETQCRSVSPVTP